MKQLTEQEVAILEDALFFFRQHQQSSLTDGHLDQEQYDQDMILVRNIEKKLNI